MNRENADGNDDAPNEKLDKRLGDSETPEYQQDDNAHMDGHFERSSQIGSIFGIGG